MKTPFVPHSPNAFQAISVTAVPLHKLVDQLMTGLLPLAVGKKTFILNDVDLAFTLQADEDVLAFILGNMMSNAVSSTDSGCIHVEAAVNNEKVQIKVRNNGACFYSAVSQGFRQVVQAARQLGGDISICNHRHEGTSVIFSIGSSQKIAC